MAEPFQNPGQIDINLGLAGQEEIRQLIEGISALNASMRSISAETANRTEQQVYRSFGEAATRGAEQLTPQQAQQQLFDASGQGASYPTEPSIETDPTQTIGPSPSASTPQQEQGAIRRALGASARRTGLIMRHPVTEGVDWALEGLIPNDYAGQIGGLDPADAAMAAEMGDYGLGASGGASQPPTPPVASTDAAWWRSVNQTGMGPIQMPRFGEFTTQDALRMAARPFELFASRRYGEAREAEIAAAAEEGRDVDFSQIDVGGFTGRIAAGLGRASQLSPYVSHFSQQYLGFGGTPGAFGFTGDPNTMIDRARREGRELGGAQQLGDLPIVGGQLDQLGLNFNLPAPVRALTDLLSNGRDSAFWREVTRVREANRYAGVDKGEAADFYDAMIAHGRTRQIDQREFMRTGFRLMSDEGIRGLNRQIIEDFLTQGTQYDTSARNLEELANQLERIPESSKAARLGMDEMGQAVLEMANQFQEIGGTLKQGARFANDFANITGMSPQVGSQLLQNEFVQSTLSLQTGMLPQTLGALPSGTITGGIADTFEMLMDLYRGSSRGGIVDIPGAGRVRVGGRQADLALVGQQMGLTPEQTRAFSQRLPQIRATGNLTNAAQVFRSQLHQATPAGRERMLTDRDPHNNLVGAPEIIRIAGRAGMSRDRQAELRRQFQTNPRAALRNVEKFAARRGQNLQQMLDENKTEVKVEFTGAAKKFFKEYESKMSDRRRSKQDVQAGRKAASARSRQPDAPAINEAWNFATFGLAGDIPESTWQYSGGGGWGELGRDLGDRAGDVAEMGEDLARGLVPNFHF